MLAHGPFYGALDIRVWDPQSDSFNYSLIFNDSSVHSLPILVNAANNARYPIIENEAIVSFIFLYINFFLNNKQRYQALQPNAQPIQTTITPLGNAAVGFDATQFASVFLVGFACIFTAVGFIGVIVTDRKIGYPKKKNV